MEISKHYIKNTLYNNSLVWKTIEFFQGMSYVFNYLWHYQFHLTAKSSIKEVNVEFSSECNLRCKFCSLDHTKPRTFIEEQTLESLLIQLLTDKRFHTVERLQLYNAGETLLHPKRFELLELIKSYKQKFKEKGVRFPKVILLTNATLLRKKVSVQLVDLDIVDEMMVSLDGGTPEAFETMRDRAKWPVFYRNIIDFIDYRNEKNSKTTLKTVSIIPAEKPFTLDWMHPEFREVLEKADSFELRRLHNWAGEVEVESTNKPHKIGCTLLMKQMVLLPNGDITVCCSDLNSRGVIGNLKTSTLYQIYNTPKRLSWLKLMFQNRKYEIDLCKNCETF
ncbi:MAG: radical SAM protein [Chitinophagales bacterium]|nr:radical SAM protein [Bacteroidota bacterium]MCB9225614.1 radical SAM protein [Chitinophagales bacterium]